MSRWHDSGTRRFLYRAMVKSRVEVERRVGPVTGAKRALAWPARGNLSWLAAVYGSDKGATAHRFAELYERHFGPVRHTTKTVLEIGVHRGASLQMWRDYFPRAQVYGLDINETSIPGPRIETFRGDQSDPEVLAKLRALGPFDVVIDDGSHRAPHVWASFAGLFGAVKPGGFYVIEDMHTSYWTGRYEGGPPGHPDTSVKLVQGLLDAVNRGRMTETYPAEAAAQPPVDALHIYPEIAFVSKSSAA